MPFLPKAILLTCLLVVSTLQSLLAQVEGEIEYEKEFLVGVHFHTNGGFIGGFHYRGAKALTPKMFRYWQCDMSFIKHPNELRYSNNNTGDTFIAYKMNYMTTLRAVYGRELLLFHKALDEGVQISALFGGGIAIGLLTPYYIQYQYSTEVRLEAYDPAIHIDPNRILGNGGFFTGIGETKFVPGLHLRSGLNFEYGSYTSNVTGIEVGLFMDLFPQKMVILEGPDFNPPLPNQIQNKSIFTGLYICINYGSRL